MAESLGYASLRPTQNEGDKGFCQVDMFSCADGSNSFATETFMASFSSPSHLINLLFSFNSFLAEQKHMQQVTELSRSIWAIKLSSEASLAISDKCDFSGMTDRVSILFCALSHPN